MLLNRENLLSQLSAEIATSHKIDVAVAWATPCQALTQLTNFGRSNPGKLRSIVGLTSNFTNPSALWDLRRKSLLRIKRPKTGIFHPKVFIFHKKYCVTCWIGSTNLTTHGFEINDELAISTNDSESAQVWFDKIWNTLDDATDNEILNYENAWQPTVISPVEQSDLVVKSKSDLVANAGLRMSWKEFISFLTNFDNYWRHWSRNEVDNEFSVLGETASWLNTATIGRSIITRPDWSDLSNHDYRVLLGPSGIGGDGYGLLGAMVGAGYAKNLFKEGSSANLATRREIRALLSPVIQADDNDFPDEACRFLAKVTKIKGIAGGVATRLLTLARPDRAISVNGGSHDGLARLTSIPRTRLEALVRNGDASRYGELLRWFERMPWYSSPPPTNGYERAIWSVRAALFDSAVYSPELAKR